MAESPDAVVAAFAHHPLQHADATAPHRLQDADTFAPHCLQDADTGRERQFDG